MFKLSLQVDNYERASNSKDKYLMRFYEIKTIKPLSPEQMRISNLKKQIENSRRALSVEREQQRRKKESERMAQAATPKPLST